MLLNPWFLLGLVLAFAGSNFWSYHEGQHNEVNTVKAAQTDAAAKAASDAKADAAIDYGVQQDLALAAQKHDLLEQNQKQLVAAAIAKDKAVRAAKAAQLLAGGASEAAVDCNASPATFSVLLHSIRASNAGSADSPSAGDGAVPSGNGASGPVAGSDAVRTGQHIVDPVNVPQQSGSTR